MAEVDHFAGGERERWSVRAALKAEEESRAHLSVLLLLPQAHDTGAISAHKVARGLEVRLQELERRYVALVTWQSSMYTNRQFVLFECNPVSSTMGGRRDGKLLTDECQRATKWPEPKATSPSDGLQAEVGALLAEAAM